MNSNDLDLIRKAHLKFAEDRGAHSTYCPSEVARELFPQSWRDHMDNVREVADQLIEESLLVVKQKGKPIAQNASNAIGPIRLQIK